MNNTFYIGLDIGSTSIKSVVLDSRYNIVWKKYERHETKQIEKTLAFLTEIEKEFKVTIDQFKIFLTGSGSSSLADILGGKHIQEVNAISFAIEKYFPNAGSIIELGGQDAKIILFIKDETTGKIKKIASMNDKCAGGTGSVIDKISSKLKIPQPKIATLGYNGYKIHHIAGKCGVFAETDINGLQKQGICPEELMASLFESIVQQNLSVLTRGFTLRPEVILLGGPNTFIKGMLECWQYNIKKLWKERKFSLGSNSNLNSLIYVPENSEYYASIGAILFGNSFRSSETNYQGVRKFEEFYKNVNPKKTYKSGSFTIAPLYQNVDEFKAKYTIPKFISKQFNKGEDANLFVGFDCGSTSSKAVLIDSNREVVEKYYQISKGNPIDDVKEIFEKLQEKIERNGARLNILGVGVTGYAKNIIKDSINADISLVETIAHTNAAKHFYGNIDVICDVGGQDIKIIMLRNGRVVDFKLNTQCSAGNGYFLQNTAEGFGFSMNEYADRAFESKNYPDFGYGCAVFLQSDIVNFQRLGWTREEILAGLACVLPKNIWMYICQIPNLPLLGSTFILQGGTQYNLAAAKAQIDFIESKFREKDSIPNIIIHKHSGECGAIGAALESVRMYELGHRTKFIGLNKVNKIKYKTFRDDRTVCHFCKNKCIRTFIDISTSNIVEHTAGEIFPFKSGAEELRAGRLESTQLEDFKKKHEKIDLSSGDTRLIIATCEKGAVEDVNDMKEIQKEINAIKEKNPNLLELSSNIIWQSFNPERINKGLIKRTLFRESRIQEKVMSRENIVIGIPRVLNLFQFAPFFTAYFESLGIKHSNIVFSDFTSEKLYREGSKRGSIDPCFPSKVTLSHINNLLDSHNARRKINFIFFPMVDNIPSELHHTVDHRSCPAGLATPEVVKAAYTKESDIFKENNIEYINPFINLNNERLTKVQIFESLKNLLNLTKEENNFAVYQGYEALKKYSYIIQEKGRGLLEQIIREDRIGIVILSRPYHGDIGLNHGIPEEFQKLGYPIFTLDSLPLDKNTLDNVFLEDIRNGVISDPLEISDVWKNSFSENTNKKLWAAKFIARHPNLIALELSSFKCGHDAPIYTVLREIIENSGTPLFTFRDIDENKPSGSIKIRVETIDYFLKRYQEYKYLNRNYSNSSSSNLFEKILSFKDHN